MKQAAYFVDGFWHVSNELFPSYEDAMKYAIDHGNPLKVVWPARFRLVEMLLAVNTPNNPGGLEKIYELELMVTE